MLAVYSNIMISDYKQYLIVFLSPLSRVYHKQTEEVTLFFKLRWLEPKLARLLPVLAIFLAGGTMACSSIFYYPSKHEFTDPAKLGFYKEDIYFKSSDGILLHGWLFPVPPDIQKKGTVVQFHGNAENISTHFLSLVWLVQEGYELFIFDYRGYGKSEGEPSPAGVHKDALAALEYTHKLILRKEPAIKNNTSPKFITFGQSIGGAVLLRALKDYNHKEDIEVVVVDSTFYSYKDLVREKLASSFITWPLQPLAYLLISDNYAPGKNIGKIPAPLLVIHGNRDAIIPLMHGKKVFELAGEPKEFWLIEGGRHTDSMTRHDGKYRKKLLQFFENLNPDYLSSFPE